MSTVNFLHPEFFWLFLLLPLLLIWQFFTHKKQLPTVTISSTNAFKQQKSVLAKLQPMLFVLRILALVILIVALAKPRSEHESLQKKLTKGIDIVMAIDVSSSMLATDLKPNRLEALKEVASTFISERFNDRIGLVVYAAESYTRTPVTSDKAVLQQSLQNIYFDNTIIEDGTGIGVGLATAINRIKDSKAKSRVIILLTDGVNNAGTIDPIMAADIAKKYGIKVYTIGIGTNGVAKYPVSVDYLGNIIYQNAKVEIDEKLMKKIAEITDGNYYRASSNSKLKEIYNDINKLETTEITEKKFFQYNELFKPLIWLAFALLLLEIILRNTVFKRFV